MQEWLNSQERLEILREIDRQRHWYSLDDKRVCAVCDRIISGRQIEIRGRPGHFTLHCPTEGCPSSYSHWFFYQPDRKAEPTLPSESGWSEASFLSSGDS